MARPTATRTTPTATLANPRVRDFGGRPTEIVVAWDVRTAFDFAFSLSEEAGTETNLVDADRRWLLNARRDLRRDVGDAAYRNVVEGLCVVLAQMIVDRPEVADARTFARLVEGADDETIVRTLLHDDLDDPETRSLAEQALAGDDAAVRALGARLASDHPSKSRDRIVQLYRDPAQVAAQARLVVAAWLPRFAPIEEHVASLIRRDYDLRAEDRATLHAADLVERTTGGIRVLPDAAHRRVILAPSYFARPYNFLLSGADWRFFGYPISDAALDATDPLGPTPAIVRLHRALGDETRLRILRLLRDRDLYLTEIAQHLELSKPTISHHLVQLRAAGLVTVVAEGGLTYYSLRPERLDDASAELRTFLLG